MQINQLFTHLEIKLDTYKSYMYNHLTMYKQVTDVKLKC